MACQSKYDHNHDCRSSPPLPRRIITDLDAPKGAYLMGPHEEGSHNVVTLLLTGRATPYLHNGVVYVGDEDHYALPQFGILARASVGLLVLGTEAEIAIMVSTRKKTIRQLTHVVFFCPTASNRAKYPDRA